MLEVKKDKAAAPKKSAKVAAVAFTYGPAYVDQKIDTIAKGFEKSLKAMSAEAVKTVKAYHKGALPAKSDSFGEGRDFFATVYPVLRVAQYAELYWELMKFLAQHKADPNRRNEKLVIDRREKLLDHLDRWALEPLWDAYKDAASDSARRKAYSAHHALQQEQRRLRLGLTQAAFAKLRKHEQAEYKRMEAERKAKYDAEDAERKAKVAKAKAGLTLA